MSSMSYMEFKCPRSLFCWVEHKHIEFRFLYIKNSWVKCEMVGEMGEGGQKVQNSSFEINKSWGYDVLHGDCSSSCCVVYLKIAKRVDIKSSHHKKKKLVTMCDDGC